jgi:phosphoribosyl 1,2-cyclic phosphodiesterase
MLKIEPLASSSAGNCYIISSDSSTILIDCGINIKHIKSALWERGLSLQSLDFCLVDHEHQDHLKYANKIAEAGVDIYCSKGTAESIKTPSMHRIHHIAAHKPVTVKGWHIYPFDTVHDSIEPLGFVLSHGGNRLLFATDTAYIKYRFKDLNFIMVEANYSRDLLHESDVHEKVRARIVQSHFSIENVLEMLQANDLSNVQEIWLLHLSENHADPREFKRLVQEATGIPVKIAERRRVVDGNYSPAINIKKTTGQVKRRWG